MRFESQLMVEINIRVQMAFLAGKSSTEQTFAERSYLGDLNTLTIERRSPAAFGREEFSAGRVEDDASYHFVIPNQSQGHAEDREAVCEVRGSVEGIDIPETLARAF